MVKKFIGNILRNPTVAGLIINKLTNSALPRPYPFSLWAPPPALPPDATEAQRREAEKTYLSSVSDYTAWVGLFDQTYTKRHLPPASASFAKELPPVEEVLPLFRRSESSYKLSEHTSALFPFFAQWFTDSFLRTHPADWHKNTSNHEIDLCQIYGLKESTTSILRTHEGGRLKSQMINGEEYPPFLCEEKGGEVVIKEEFRDLPNMQLLVENYKKSFVVRAGLSEEESQQRLLKFYAAGLDRANSSIGYSLMNTIFIRGHNHISKKLQQAYSDWDDERLFQTTRNILIVILLKIVVVDYIKHISGGSICAMPKIGFAEKQKWYRKNWMAVEFTLLYRWHILIPDALQVSEEQSVLWQQFMYNPGVLSEHGVVPLAQLWSKQAAGASGLFNTPDFLMEAKRSSLEFSRKARLRSYNEYRQAFGFKKLNSLDELDTTEESKKALKELYQNDINKVEFLVGLWAENPSAVEWYGDVAGLYPSMFGPSILTMVGVDAFSQALTNPLLSENIYNADTFSKVGLDIIDSVETLSQLIKRVAPDADCNEISFRLQE